MSFCGGHSQKGTETFAYTLAAVPRVVLGTEIKVTVGEMGRRREGRCGYCAGPVVVVHGREGKVAWYPDSP